MIDKAKKYLKEVKELNKQGRAILNEMKKTRNPQKLEALKKELDLVQDKVSVILPLAFEEAESDSPTPPKDEVTQEQAQEVWDSIRKKIRLAKFNDEGIELPAIDMAKLFRGRKSATLRDINSQVKDIINGWEPVTD